MSAVPRPFRRARAAAGSSPWPSPGGGVDDEPQVGVVTDREGLVAQLEPADDRVGEEREALVAMFEQIPALTARDVAEVIAFAAARPAHVNLRQLALLPTRPA